MAKKPANKKFKGVNEEKGGGVVCIPLSGEHIIGDWGKMTTLCGERVHGYRFALPGYENEELFKGVPCSICNDKFTNKGIPA